MSDERTRAATPRRDLLRAAVGGAAVLGSSLAAAPASAGAKMTQKLVHYQTTPKGSARCQTCSQYLPTPGCKLVDDPIAPTGWCLLYAAKA
jgi:hypothetical protein